MSTLLLDRCAELSKRGTPRVRKKTPSPSHSMTSNTTSSNKISSKCSATIEVHSDRLLIDGEYQDPNAFRPYPLDSLAIGTYTGTVVRMRTAIGRFRLMLIRSFEIRPTTFRKIR